MAADRAFCLPNGTTDLLHYPGVPDPETRSAEPIRHHVNEALATCLSTNTCMAGIKTSQLTPRAVLPWLKDAIVGTRPWLNTRTWIGQSPPMLPVKAINPPRVV